MSKIVFIGFLILLPNLAYADAIPEEILQASYCEGVLVEQALKVQNPPDETAKLAGKVSKLGIFIQSSKFQDKDSMEYLSQIFNVGVKDFDDYAASIIASRECIGFDKEKKDACYKATLVNTDKIRNCNNFKTE